MDERSSIVATVAELVDFAARACRLHIERADVPMLAEQVEQVRVVSAESAPGDPVQAACLTNLGLVLTELFYRTADTEYVRHSIDAHQRAVSATEPGAPDRATYLSNLGGAWRAVYAYSNDLEALAQAIRCLETTVAETPPGDPNEAGFLHNLGTALLRWFERTGDGAVHKVSIVALAGAAGLMSASDPALATTLGKFAEAWQPWTDAHPAAEVSEQSGELYEVAVALHRLSWQSEDSAVFDAAAEVARAALAAAGIAERGMYLGMLTDVLLARSARTEEVAAHRAVVAEIDAAVADTPVDHPDRAQLLSCLGAAQDQLYLRTQDRADTADATRSWRAVLKVLPAEHEARAGVASHLGNSLFVGYGHSRHLADLDEAIELLRESLTGTAVGTPEYALIRGNLGSMLSTRARAVDDPDLLGEALTLLCAAVADNAARPLDDSLQNNLGQALHHLSETTGHPAVLHRIVTDLIEEQPAAADRLTRVSWALGWVHERIGDPALLEQKVRLGRAAVAASAHETADSGPHHSDLGNSLMLLYSRTRERALLDEAIAAHRAAVAVARPEHRHLALNNLGIAVQAAAALDDDLPLMREAVATLRASIEATPAEHPERAQRLGFLRENLDAVYHVTHASADLEAAVDIGRATLEVLDAEHPDRAHCLRRHASLSVDLLERRAGAETARKTVAELGAAEAVTPADHPEHVRIRIDSSRALQVLFERTGDLLLLDEAAQHGRAAIAAATDPAARAGALDVYSGVLRTQFERTNFRPFIQQAVDVSRDAAATMPADRGEREVYLDNLSLHLVLLGESARDEGALAEAVRIRVDVLEQTADDHPNRPLRLVNLAGAMVKLAGQTAEPELLDEAAELCRTALALAPDDSPLLPVLRYNLGAIVQKLSFDAERAALFDSARAALRGLSGAPIALQVKGCRLLAALEVRLGAHDSALRELERAVELMPLVAPRGLMRADRVYLLRQQSGLARDIAAVGVAADHLEWAVELLEQTRGQLMSETVYERRDLAELRELEPELAAEFEAIRRRAAELELTELSREVLEPDYVPERPVLDVADERLALDRRWTEILERIRALDRFRRFLRPPGIDTLRAAAAEGPIVLCYAGDDSGGGALIVTDDPQRPVRVVALPELTSARLADQVIDLWRAVDIAAVGSDLRARQAAQPSLRNVLAWQWDAIAEPVLRHLGVTGIAARRPRIWWSPIGAVALLPLHAAGHHDGGDRTVLDRTICSYTANLGALWYSRLERSRSAEPAALLVSMPTTPDAAALPSAEAETERVARLLPEPMILREDAATYASVTEALRSHSIAHFACHAETERDNPAVSYIMLHDHRTQPLTVNALIGLDLTDAELAYLSACDTTSTHPNTADEAIHLVAATQLAGYRHVIGTMWAINDQSALDVATGFYENLTDKGTSAPHTERSAEALNEAVRRHRDAYPRLPTRWAAHLHYGA
ncbi:CHAT domain-containing protein [Nocardia sp. NPDC127579]|uniref:CHAT domain-containing protein n=1 Tax=Nocardia sp. NPDC127579 TaxID=3345402 RepID=UPI00363D0378